MCRSVLYILHSDGALWTSSVRRSVIDRLDSDGVLSRSSLGLLACVCYTEKAPNAWERRGAQKTRNTYNQLACVSHEPAAGHEAVPVDSRVTWAEVS